MQCVRCGNKNRFLFEKLYCPDCTECYYCIKCAHISIFKLCDKLKDNLIFSYEHVSFKLQYKLTNNQKQLSQDIQQYIKTNNIFINATCGAGKTEIVFKVIENYINNSKHVCFVVPRIEVVHELYLRFNKAFNTTFGIVTGEKKNFNGAMFFMTCNQLVNYQDIFDLVIVDEADAFPLENDNILKAGIKKSLRKDGKLIMMSATPLKIPRTYIILTLFERYHKQEIPVPIFTKTSIELLKEKVKKGKWIVFFPTIKCLNEIYNLLGNKEIIICHSKITNISEKMSALKDEYIIFSTAILERGITLSNINVIVFDTHHDNFEVNTLVQISGRVGRVFPHTKGEIIFMGEYKTKSIKDSIEFIRGLND